MTNLKFGEENISKTCFQLEQMIVNIDTYHCKFSKWRKDINFDTYGGKCILNWKEEPLFAELFVLRILEEQQFKGVWVDTYRGKFWEKHPSFSSPVIDLHPILRDIYSRIKHNNQNKRKGCWDVLAIRDNDILFVELKRTKKDAIRQSQADWLQAGFDAGLTEDNFIIVEWDYSQ